MSSPNHPSSERLSAAAERLRATGTDALLLTPGADQFYLTGFEHTHAFKRLLALILKADGSANWITPQMNESQVREFALPGHPVRAWGDEETYLPALRDALAGIKSVAFDDEARSAFLLDLLDAAQSTQLRRASDVTRSLRIRKTPAELELMRYAAKTVDDAIPTAVSLCVAGRTEEEVAELLQAELLRSSTESTIGFTIIASGPNGAFPHHDTGRRKLEEGDVVIVDYGTRYRGYNSDITVTCSVGEPRDPDVRKIYRIVWEAQQKALETVRPGAACQEIDRAARRVIEAAGYGEYFIHRTGHGLGIQIHEPPFMLEGNEERLEEGMVFSVEPGIYLPGRFGVRLEVIASCGSDGVSMINAPRVGELPISPG
jgi:D-alanyl-D-alanine dipeptidase